MKKKCKRSGKKGVNSKKNSEQSNNSSLVSGLRNKYFTDGKQEKTSQDVKPAEESEPKQTGKPTEYDIFRPWLTLDPWQKKYIACERNCFVLCGRQSGKTAAAAIKFGNRAAENDNRIILMIAYTEKQAFNLFFKTLNYLETKHPHMIKYGKNRPTKHVINLTNGSIIMCYAAGIHGDGLRGPTITDLVVDEAAPMAYEVFQSITPMISITGGTIDIISTGRGKEGFFYDCSKNDNYEKFVISAEDCPRHTKEFLAGEAAWMSKLMYAQEYKAMFLDELKRVFSDAWVKRVCNINEEDKPVAGEDLFFGGDVGRVNDPSTFEILDGTEVDDVRQIYHDEIRVIKIPETFREIRRLERIWRFNKIGIDSGGMGSGVLDLLLEDNETKWKSEGLDNATKIINADEDEKPLLKIDMYTNMLVMGEQGKLHLFDNEEVVASLKSIQWDVSNEKTKISGTNAHAAEGIMRGLQLIKSKGLRLYAL